MMAVPPSEILQRFKTVVVTGMFLLPAYCAENGLKSGVFRGIPTLQTVECSGEAISPDTTFLTMSLFVARDNKILASVNPRDNECSTSEQYSACVIDHTDYRKTKLISLVTPDFGHTDLCRYGCNVTGFRAGKSSFITWYIQLQQPTFPSRGCCYSNSVKEDINYLVVTSNGWIYTGKMSKINSAWHSFSNEHVA